MQFGSKNTSIKHIINKSSKTNIIFGNNSKTFTINSTLLNTVQSSESFP